MLATTRASVMALLVLGFAIAQSGCETSGDGILPEEDRLVEDMMETYVSARFHFYPVEATLSGLPGNDDRLGDFSHASIDERIQWLTNFHYKLLGLRLTSLSQPAYVDALWLTSLVKSELFELEVRGVWRRSASFYADVARLGLVTILAEGELASRTNALSSRLAEIPRLLGQAHENISAADRMWQDDGRVSLGNVQSLLEDLPKLIEGRLPPPQVAELAGLSREATRAVQELLASPAVLQPTQAPLGYALGAEDLERYFFHRHMLDWALDKITLNAENELDAATNALAELALDRFPSEPLAAVLSPKRLEGPIDTVVVAAQSRVLSFLRERDGSRPLDASIPVRRVPAYFPGSEAVQLWRPKALEPARGAFLMVREVDRPDANELELLTLRELGGRARQYAYQASSASLLRRVVSAPATREGWLAQFERSALAHRLHENSDELRVEHFQRAILDFTRLLVLIEVQAHRLVLDDAATMFRERAFLSEADARAEAARVAVDPSSGDSALGRLLFEELEADYFRSYPLETLSAFEDLVLEEGLLPVRLLRFQLLP